MAELRDALGRIYNVEASVDQLKSLLLQDVTAKPNPVAMDKEPPEKKEERKNTEEIRDLIQELVDYDLDNLFDKLTKAVKDAGQKAEDHYRAEGRKVTGRTEGQKARDVGGFKMPNFDVLYQGISNVIKSSQPKTLEIPTITVAMPRGATGTTAAVEIAKLGAIMETGFDKLAMAVSEIDTKDVRITDMPFGYQPDKLDPVEVKITTEPGEAPPVNMGDIKLPEIKLPDIVLPEIKLPEVKMPDMPAPQVHVTVPEIRIEETKTDKVAADKIDLTSASVQAKTDFVQLSVGGQLLIPGQVTLTGAVTVQMAQIQGFTPNVNVIAQVQMPPSLLVQRVEAVGLIEQMPPVTLLGLDDLKALVATLVASLAGGGGKLGVQAGEAVVAIEFKGFEAALDIATTAVQNLAGELDEVEIPRTLPALPPVKREEPDVVDTAAERLKTAQRTAQPPPPVTGEITRELLEELAADAGIDTAAASEVLELELAEIADVMNIAHEATAALGVHVDELKAGLEQYALSLKGGTPKLEPPLDITTAEQLEILRPHLEELVKLFAPQLNATQVVQQNIAELTDAGTSKGSIFTHDVGTHILLSEIISKLGVAKTIPAMAEGGIVKQPTTALIGEAGPEAVIPLEKLPEVAAPQTPTQAAEQTAQPKKKILKRVAEGVDKATDVPGVKQVKDVSKEITKRFYTYLEKRYGPTMAKVILASGQAVGWGATGVGAAFGVPIWLPGSIIWGGLPLVGVLEFAKFISKKLRKHKELNKELIEEAGLSELAKDALALTDITSQTISEQINIDEIAKSVPDEIVKQLPLAMLSDTQTPDIKLEPMKPDEESSKLPLKPMAKGGIVTGPTPALIGEAGPEAVIPLDKMPDPTHAIQEGNKLQATTAENIAALAAAGLSKGSIFVHDEGTHILLAQLLNKQSTKTVTPADLTEVKAKAVNLEDIVRGTATAIAGETKTFTAQLVTDTAAFKPEAFRALEDKTVTAFLKTDSSGFKPKSFADLENKTATATLAIAPADFAAPTAWTSLVNKTVTATLVTAPADFAAPAAWTSLVNKEVTATLKTDSSGFKPKSFVDLDSKTVTATLATGTLTVPEAWAALANKTVTATLATAPADFAAPAAWTSLVSKTVTATLTTAPANFAAPEAWTSLVSKEVTATLKTDSSGFKPKSFVDLDSKTVTVTLTVAPADFAAPAGWIALANKTATATLATSPDNFAAPEAWTSLVSKTVTATLLVAPDNFAAPANWVGLIDKTITAFLKTDSGGFKPKSFVDLASKDVTATLAVSPDPFVLPDAWTSLANKTATATLAIAPANFAAPEAWASLVNKTVTATLIVAPDNFGAPAAWTSLVNKEVTATLKTDSSGFKPKSFVDLASKDVTATLVVSPTDFAAPAGWVALADKTVTATLTTAPTNFAAPEAWTNLVNKTVTATLTTEDKTVIATLKAAPENFTAPEAWTNLVNKTVTATLTTAPANFTAPEAWTALVNKEVTATLKTDSKAFKPKAYRELDNKTVTATLAVAGTLAVPEAWAVLADKTVTATLVTAPENFAAPEAWTSLVDKTVTATLTSVDRGAATATLAVAPTNFAAPEAWTSLVSKTVTATLKTAPENFAAPEAWTSLVSKEVTATLKTDSSGFKPRAYKSLDNKTVTATLAVAPADFAAPAAWTGLVNKTVTATLTTAPANFAAPTEWTGLVDKTVTATLKTDRRRFKLGSFPKLEDKTVSIGFQLDNCAEMKTKFISDVQDCLSTIKQIDLKQPISVKAQLAFEFDNPPEASKLIIPEPGVDLDKLIKEAEAASQAFPLKARGGGPIPGLGMQQPFLPKGEVFGDYKPGQYLPVNAAKVKEGVESELEKATKGFKVALTLPIDCEGTLAKLHQSIADCLKQLSAVKIATEVVTAIGKVNVPLDMSIDCDSLMKTAKPEIIACVDKIVDEIKGKTKKIPVGLVCKKGGDFTVPKVNEIIGELAGSTTLAKVSVGLKPVSGGEFTVDNVNAIIKEVTDAATLAKVRVGFEVKKQENGLNIETDINPIIKEVSDAETLGKIRVGFSVKKKDNGLSQDILGGILSAKLPAIKISIDAASAAALKDSLEKALVIPTATAHVQTLDVAADNITATLKMPAATLTVDVLTIDAALLNMKAAATDVSGLVTTPPTTPPTTGGGGGGSVLDLIYNEIKRLTDAATTDSTIYVRDTVSHAKLDEIKVTADAMLVQMGMSSRDIVDAIANAAQFIVDQMMDLIVTMTDMTIDAINNKPVPGSSPDYTTILNDILNAIRALPTSGGGGGITRADLQSVLMPVTTMAMNLASIMSGECLSVCDKETHSRLEKLIKKTKVTREEPREPKKTGEAKAGAASVMASPAGEKDTGKKKTPDYGGLGLIRGVIDPINRVKRALEAFTDALIGMNPVQEAFKGLIKDEATFRRELNQTLFITQGIGAEQRGLQRQYEMAEQTIADQARRWREISTITGQDIGMAQREYIQILRRGIKGQMVAERLMKTSLNLATMIGAKAEDVAEMMSRWKTELRMDNIQLGQMNRYIREVAANSGLMGENLMRAVKSSEQFLIALRNSGLLTAETARNFIAIRAAAQRMGVQNEVDAMLRGLQSGSDFLMNMDDDMRNFMAIVAGGYGGPGLLQNLVYGRGGSRASMKQMAAALRNFRGMLISEMSGGKATDLDSLNLLPKADEIKMLVDVIMQRMSGGKIRIGNIDLTADAFDEAGRSFAETIQMIDRDLARITDPIERATLLEHRRQALLQQNLSIQTQLNTAITQAQRSGRNISDLQAFLRTKVGDMLATNQDFADAVRAMGISSTDGVDIVRSSLEQTYDDLQARLQRLGRPELLRLRREEIAAALASKNVEAYQGILQQLTEAEQAAAKLAMAGTDQMSYLTQAIRDLNATIRGGSNVILRNFLDSVGTTGLAITAFGAGVLGAVLSLIAFQAWMRSLRLAFARVFKVAGAGGAAAGTAGVAGAGGAAAGTAGAAAGTVATGRATAWLAGRFGLLGEVLAGVIAMLVRLADRIRAVINVIFKGGALFVRAVGAMTGALFASLAGMGARLANVRWLFQPLTDALKGPTGVLANIGKALKKIGQGLLWVGGMLLTGLGKIAKFFGWLAAGGLGWMVGWWRSFRAFLGGIGPWIGRQLQWIGGLFTSLGQAIAGLWRSFKATSVGQFFVRLGDLISKGFSRILVPLAQGMGGVLGRVFTGLAGRISGMGGMFASVGAALQQRLAGFVNLFSKEGPIGSFLSRLGAMFSGGGVKPLAALGRITAPVVNAFRWLLRVLGPVALAFGAIQGALEASAHGFTMLEGALFGLVTGGVRTGSMFSGAAGVARGSKGDQALGIAGAAAQGAILGAMIAPLLGPLAPLAPLIGALAGAILELYKIVRSGGSLAQDILALWAKVQQAWSIFLRGIEMAWQNLLPRLSALFEEMKQTILNEFQGIFGDARGALSDTGIEEAFRNIGYALIWVAEQSQWFVDVLFQGFGEGLERTWALIRPAIQGIIRIFTNLYKAIQKFAAGDTASAWEDIGAAISEGLKAAAVVIVLWFLGLPALIVGALGSTLRSLASRMDGQFGVILDAAGRFFQGLGDALQALIDTISAVFSGDSAAIEAGLQRLGRSLAESLLGLADFVYNALKDLPDIVERFIGGLPGQIAEPLRGVWQVLKPIVTGVINFFNKLGSAIRKGFGGDTEGMWADLKDAALQGLKAVAIGIIVYMYGLPYLILGAVGPMISDLGRRIGGKFGEIVTALGDAFAGIGGAFRNIIGIISSLIDGDMAAVRDQLQQLGQNIGKALKGIADVIWKTFAGLGDLVRNGLQRLRESVGDEMAGWIKPLERIWGALEPIFNGIAKAFEKISSAVSKAMAGDWSGMFRDLGDAIMHGMEAVITGLILYGWIDVVLGAVGDIMQEIGRGIGGHVGGLVEGFGKILSAIGDYVWGLIDISAGLFKGIATGDWSQFTQGLYRLRDALVGLLGGLAQAFGNLDKVIDSLMENLQSALPPSLFDPLKRAWDLLRPVVQALARTFQGLYDVIQGMIEGDWDKVWRGLGNALLGALELTIQGIIFYVIGWPALIVGALGKALENLGAWLARLGKVGKMIGSLVSALGQALRGVGDFIQGVLDFFRALFTWDTAKMKEAGQKILNAVLDILKGLGKFIIKAIIYIIAGVIAAIAGLGSLIWKGLKAAWNWISDPQNWIDALAALPGLIGGFFRNVILEIPNWIADALKGIGNWLIEVIAEALNDIGIGVDVEAIKAVWETIVDVVMWVPRKIFDFFKWLYDVLVGHSIIPDLIEGIIGWFLRLPVLVYRALARLAQFVLNAIGNALTNLGQSIGGPIGSIITRIGGFFNKLGEIAGKVAGYFDGWWKALSGIFTLNPSRILEGLGQIWDAVRNIPSLAIQAIGNLGNIIFDALKGLGEWIIRGIFSGIENLAGLFGIDLDLSAYADAIVAVWDYVVEYFRNIWLTLIGSIQQIWSGIVALFETGDPDQLFQAIFSALEGIGGILFDIVGNAIGGIGQLIIDGISGIFSTIGDWLGIDLSWIGQALTDVWTGFIEWFKNIPRGIANFFRSVWDWLRSLPGRIADLAERAWRWLISLPGRIGRAVLRFGEWLMAWILDLVGGLVNGLIDMLPGWVQDLLGISGSRMATDNAARVTARHRAEDEAEAAAERAAAERAEREAAAEEARRQAAEAERARFEQAIRSLQMVGEMGLTLSNAAADVATLQQRITTQQADNLRRTLFQGANTSRTIQAAYQRQLEPLTTAQSRQLAILQRYNMGRVMEMLYADNNIDQINIDQIRDELRRTEAITSDDQMRELSQALEGYITATRQLAELQAAHTRQLAVGIDPRAQAMENAAYALRDVEQARASGQDTRQVQMQLTRTLAAIPEAFNMRATDPRAMEQAASVFADRLRQPGFLADQNRQNRLLGDSLTFEEKQTRLQQEMVDLQRQAAEAAGRGDMERWAQLMERMGEIQEAIERLREMRNVAGRLRTAIGNVNALPPGYTITTPFAPNLATLRQIAAGDESVRPSQLAGDPAGWQALIAQAVAELNEIELRGALAVNENLDAVFNLLRGTFEERANQAVSIMQMAYTPQQLLGTTAAMEVLRRGSTIERQQYGREQLDRIMREMVAAQQGTGRFAGMDQNERRRQMLILAQQAAAIRLAMNQRPDPVQDAVGRFMAGAGFVPGFRADPQMRAAAINTLVRSLPNDPTQALERLIDLIQRREDNIVAILRDTNGQTRELISLTEILNSRTRAQTDMVRLLRTAVPAWSDQQALTYLQTELMPLIEQGQSVRQVVEAAIRTGGIRPTDRTAFETALTQWLEANSRINAPQQLLMIQRREGQDQAAFEAEVDALYQDLARPLLAQFNELLVRARAGDTTAQNQLANVVTDLTLLESARTLAMQRQGYAAFMPRFLSATGTTGTLPSRQAFLQPLEGLSGPAFMERTVGIFNEMLRQELQNPAVWNRLMPGNFAAVANAPTLAARRQTMLTLAEGQWRPAGFTGNQITAEQRMTQLRTELTRLASTRRFWTQSDYERYLALMREFTLMTAAMERPIDNAAAAVENLTSVMPDLARALAMPRGEARDLALAALRPRRAEIGGQLFNASIQGMGPTGRPDMRRVATAMAGVSADGSRFEFNRAWLGQLMAMPVFRQLMELRGADRDRRIAELTTALTNRFEAAGRRMQDLQRQLLLAQQQGRTSDAQALQRQLEEVQLELEEIGREYGAVQAASAYVSTLNRALTNPAQLMELIQRRVSPTGPFIMTEQQRQRAAIDMYREGPQRTTGTYAIQRDATSGRITGISAEGGTQSLYAALTSVRTRRERNMLAAQMRDQLQTELQTTWETLNNLISRGITSGAEYDRARDAWLAVSRNMAEIDRALMEPTDAFADAVDMFDQAVQLYNNSLRRSLADSRRRLDQLEASRQMAQAAERLNAALSTPQGRIAVIQEQLGRITIDQVWNSDILAELMEQGPDWKDWANRRVGEIDFEITETLGAIEEWGARVQNATTPDEFNEALRQQLAAQTGLRDLMRDQAILFQATRDYNTFREAWDWYAWADEMWDAGEEEAAEWGYYMADSFIERLRTRGTGLRIGPDSTPVDIMITYMNNTLPAITAQELANSPLMTEVLNRTVLRPADIPRLIERWQERNDTTRQPTTGELLAFARQWATDAIERQSPTLVAPGTINPDTKIINYDAFGEDELEFISGMWQEWAGVFDRMPDRWELRDYLRLVDPRHAALTPRNYTRAERWDLIRDNRRTNADILLEDASRRYQQAMASGNVTQATAILQEIRIILRSLKETTTDAYLLEEDNRMALRRQMNAILGIPKGPQRDVPVSQTRWLELVNTMAALSATDAAGGGDAAQILRRAQSDTLIQQLQTQMAILDTLDAILEAVGMGKSPEEKARERLAILIPAFAQANREFGALVAENQRRLTAGLPPIPEQQIADAAARLAMLRRMLTQYGGTGGAQLAGTVRTTTGGHAGTHDEVTNIPIQAPTAESLLPLIRAINQNPPTSEAFQRAARQLVDIATVWRTEVETILQQVRRGEGPFRGMEINPGRMNMIDFWIAERFRMLQGATPPALPSGAPSTGGFNPNAGLLPGIGGRRGPAVTTPTPRREDERPMDIFPGMLEAFRRWRIGVPGGQLLPGMGGGQQAPAGSVQPLPAAQVGPGDTAITPGTIPGIAGAGPRMDGIRPGQVALQDLFPGQNLGNIAAIQAQMQAWAAYQRREALVRANIYERDGGKDAYGLPTAVPRINPATMRPYTQQEAEQALAAEASGVRVTTIDPGGQINTTIVDPRTVPQLQAAVPPIPGTMPVPMDAPWYGVLPQGRNDGPMAWHGPAPSWDTPHGIGEIAGVRTTLPDWMQAVHNIRAADAQDPNAINPAKPWAARGPRFFEPRDLNLDDEEWANFVRALNTGLLNAPDILTSPTYQFWLARRPVAQPNGPQTVPRNLWQLVQAADNVYRIQHGLQPRNLMPFIPVRPGVIPQQRNQLGPGWMPQGQLQRIPGPVMPGGQMMPGPVMPGGVNPGGNPLFPGGNPGQFLPVQPMGGGGGNNILSMLEDWEEGPVRHATAAVGTNLVTRTGLSLIHRGEAIIPAAWATRILNAIGPMRTTGPFRPDMVMARTVPTDLLTLLNLLNQSIRRLSDNIEQMNLKPTIINFDVTNKVIEWLRPVVEMLIAMQDWALSGQTSDIVESVDYLDMSLYEIGQTMLRMFYENKGVFSDLMRTLMNELHQLAYMDRTADISEGINYLEMWLYEIGQTLLRTGYENRRGFAQLPYDGIMECCAVISESMAQLLEFGEAQARKTPEVQPTLPTSPNDPEERIKKMKMDEMLNTAKDQLEAEVRSAEATEETAENTEELNKLFKKAVILLEQIKKALSPTPKSKPGRPGSNEDIFDEPFFDAAMFSEVEYPNNYQRSAGFEITSDRD